MHRRHRRADKGRSPAAIRSATFFLFLRDIVGRPKSTAISGSAHADPICGCQTYCFFLARLHGLPTAFLKETKRQHCFCPLPRIAPAWWVDWLALSRRLTRSKLADILLVDRNLAHVWKPMLHTFAAGTANYTNENISFISHAKRNHFRYWPGELSGLSRSRNRSFHLRRPVRAESSKLPRPASTTRSLV